MEDLYKDLYNGFIDSVFENAEANLVNDSNLWNVVPTAYAISTTDDKHTIFSIPWKTHDEKIEMLKVLGENCFEGKVTKIGIVVDIALKRYSEKPDDDTELPLSYPVNMRSEAFIFSYIDFINPSENEIRIFPYRINDKKIVRLEEFPKTDLVNFHEIFSSMIAFGFTKKAMMDEFLKKEILTGDFNAKLGNELLKEVLHKYPGANLGLGTKNKELQ